MKTAILFTAAAALAASVAAADIKEKLRQFRDPANVNQENVFKLLNDRHARRMEKLGELLEERQTQLVDHERGHRKLNTEDHARVTRQSVNFERKLTQLKSVDPTEHADMMQHDAESLYRLNSVDYLDFDSKNKN
eukprot:CAMPEP_0119006370 /NCGR_PEP_ID=MMETSP1176-20130426/2256_1 /TAXON_ID=265551 /ORGANISM="Synedropsis recta cf, Strain CCMP1620" /LENGTH=134 /DNA_ID=CAMNT_0006958279 /DNA_START=314 /DNA_END=718 /DNA_ORIENTATION=+